MVSSQSHCFNNLPRCAQQDYKSFSYCTISDTLYTYRVTSTPPSISQTMPTDITKMLTTTTSKLHLTILYTTGTSYLNYIYIFQKTIKIHYLGHKINEITLVLIKSVSKSSTGI